MKIAQPNKGTLCNTCPGIRILMTVVIKFMAPSILEIPAKCNEKMARSTDPPLWACAPANGGYTVQPVPAPDSTKELDNNKINEGGNNQKLMLFNRGNAISTAPINNGTK